MSERDELAALIGLEYEKWCMDHDDEFPWSGGAWKHVADVVLAAGYRKEATR